MHLDLVAEIWSELKRYIGTIDRSEAADSFINMLIDHDYSPEDIRTTFKSDSDIKKALVTIFKTILKNRMKTKSMKKKRTGTVKIINHVL